MFGITTFAEAPFSTLGASGAVYNVDLSETVQVSNVQTTAVDFNVTVSVGPSFNTQREEQAAGMMELLTAVPLAQNVAADLVVRSQDWVGKDALADRLEFAVEQQFPGIATQAKPEKGNEQIVYLQQQLAQCQAQLQQVGQQAQQLNEALQKSNADKNAAAAGQVEIERAKVQIEVKRLELEQAKLQGEMQLEQAKSEEDVMSIFKTNRNIYDEVKSGSPNAYDVLMDEFKQARAKHKEAA